MLLFGGPFVNGEIRQGCGRTLRNPWEAAQLVDFCMLWQAWRRALPWASAMISMRFRHLTGTGRPCSWSIRRRISTNSARHGDLGKLEHDISAVADDPDHNLDQLLAHGRQ
jgi:hypothetical protein